MVNATALKKLSAILAMVMAFAACPKDQKPTPSDLPTSPPAGDTATPPQAVDTMPSVDTAAPPDASPLTLHASCDPTPLVWAIPESNTQWISNGFDRMTTVKAPNGKFITLIAQKKVSDEMLIRTRRILEFFLTDVPGSVYGADKTEVANAMAKNQALLMLPYGVHEEGNEPNINAQPIYSAENAIEGSDWYMNNDFEHRDAAFEEIFHLVHDTGIGTYMPAALPQYQKELLAEAKAALKDGRWGISVDPGISDWIEELTAENSLAQEYIAAVIDSYYGFWGPFKEAPGGMWGIYIAKTRAEIAAKDPAGKALLEKFLSPWLTYEARIDAALQGTFSMTFDAAKPYTHKSQYLLHARLMGSLDSNLTGNAQDNTLRGNSGSNILDGAGGKDTVVYCGKQADYQLTKTADGVRVQGPDGTDTLKAVEKIRFATSEVLTESL